MAVKSSPSISLDRVGIEYFLPGTLGKSVFRPWEWRRDSTAIRALQDVSVRITEGERVALLGRNGAGKTTLLRVMAGIFQPTSGSVKTAGDIHVLLDAGFGLDYNQTGRGNCESYCIIRGFDSDRRKMLVENAKDIAQLGDAFDRPIRSYSQGMVTRLVFAISTSTSADILLLDEAMGAGDVQFQEVALRRVNDMMTGASIIVTASHSLDFLRTWFARGVVLDSGRVVFDGELEPAIDRYLNL